MDKKAVLTEEYAGQSRALLVMGIVLVALNLRPALTTVGPLVGMIRQSLHISNGVAGLLTTIPLLAFALLSILAPKIERVIGIEKAIFTGILLILIGILIRPIGTVLPLIFGTILIGSGIAMGNVLLPGIIKRRFSDRPGLMTSVYTTVMASFAGIGSGASIPLAQGLGLGWQKTLLVWGVLTLLAIICWLPQLRLPRRKSQANNHVLTTNSSIWVSQVAWQVTGFLGLQSFLYYCLITWLPEILHSTGLSLDLSGWMVFIMQFVGLPATFLAPVFADRLQSQIGLVLGVGGFYIGGIVLLLIPGSMFATLIGILLVGIAQGASISLALTFLSLRTKTAEQASALSGMAQSLGYLLASVGPFLLGSLFDALQAWTIPLVTMLLVAICMTFVGVFAGRDQKV